MSYELRAHPLGTMSQGVVSTMQPNEEIQYAPRSRPVSFYDNYKDTSMSHGVASTMSEGHCERLGDYVFRANDNNTTGTVNNNNNRVIRAGSALDMPTANIHGAVSTGNIGRICREDKEKELDRAPSMANCLSTTVPVNLAASQIAGRHTPTRNSLRHSRMIVMHRIGHRPEKFVPPLGNHRRLARCLVALQILVGLSVTALSLWLLLWAPNLPVIDNPYWSGLPLIISGVLGICLLRCLNTVYPRTTNIGLTATKVSSVILAVLATFSCSAACIISTIHLTRLMEMECSPARVLNATCVCRPRNDTSDSVEGAIRYIDLNCPEVENILTVLLIFSSACNALGVVVTCWYLYLHWNTRQKRPQYTQVRTNAVSNPLNSRPIYKGNLVEER